MKYALFILLTLLLAGCAKRVPVAVNAQPPVKAPVVSGEALPGPRLKDAGPAQVYSIGPCDAKITALAAALANRNIMVSCQYFAPDQYPVPAVHFPNQDPLTPSNFPAFLGQSGFVYDSGDNVKLLFNDGTHVWMVPMILVGNSQ